MAIGNLTKITVTPQEPAIGAVITGVDLSEPLTDEQFGEIRQALLDHLVICIRGQGHITPANQIDFAARWGVISPHPYVPSIEGHPEIMKVYDPHPITVTWHSDTTFMAEPPGETILLARVLPPCGGDTMFSSTYAVFERLSEGLRQTLRGLRAVHEGTEMGSQAGLEREALQRSHPVVRTHPATGREALYVNGNYVKHFEGWTVEESRPLLEFLYAEVNRPEFTYRHRWEHGDLVIWDNRSTQHAVVGNTGGHERELHRITIRGDAPQ
jgi:taurine dioxygenase